MSRMNAAKAIARMEQADVQGAPIEDVARWALVAIAETLPPILERLDDLAHVVAPDAPA